MSLLKLVARLYLIPIAFLVIACTSTSPGSPVPTRRSFPTATLLAPIPTEVVASTDTPTARGVTDEPLAALGESPTATMTASPTIPFKDITAVAKIDLKVRSGPGTGFAQTGILKQGTQVHLLAISQDGTWFQHETGWSAGAYLEVDGDTSRLVVVVVSTPTASPVPAATLTSTPTLTGLPTVLATLIHPTAASGGGGGGQCCKVCANSQACGDSCIARSKVCHKSPGCAC